MRVERDALGPPIVSVRHICRTCQHWNETVYGDCLNPRAANFGHFTRETDSCSKWQQGVWLRRKAARVLCSICDGEVKPAVAGWKGVTWEQQLPWLRAEQRIPLCDRCGHVIWAGERAWYKRINVEDTPREMLGLIRKVKETAGFLGRAANGGLQAYPFKDEKGETKYGY